MVLNGGFTMKKRILLSILLLGLVTASGNISANNYTPAQIKILMNYSKLLAGQKAQELKAQKQALAEERRKNRKPWTRGQKIAAWTTGVVGTGVAAYLACNAYRSGSLNPFPQVGSDFKSILSKIGFGKTQPVINKSNGQLVAVDNKLSKIEQSAPKLKQLEVAKFLENSRRQASWLKPQADVNNTVVDHRLSSNDLAVLSSVSEVSQVFYSNESPTDFIQIPKLDMSNSSLRDIPSSTRIDTGVSLNNVEFIKLPEVPKIDLPKCSLGSRGNSTVIADTGITSNPNYQDKNLGQLVLVKDKVQNNSSLPEGLLDRLDSSNREQSYLSKFMTSPRMVKEGQLVLVKDQDQETRFKLLEETPQEVCSWSHATPALASKPNKCNMCNDSRLARINSNESYLRNVLKWSQKHFDSKQLKDFKNKLYCVENCSK